jgi:hypothetical protein
VIPEDFQRCWINPRQSAHEGVMRFHFESDEQPQLYWTEVSGTDVVKKSKILGPNTIREIQPLFPFMRPRKLGVKVESRLEGGWDCTLVVEQTEFVVRRGRKRARLSLFD